jgi:cell division protein FtsL
MVKLLLCLAAALCLGTVLLQLRQQRMELNYQCNQLHTQIDAQQARLWSQQLSIAIATAPNAIGKTVQNNSLHMVRRPAQPPLSLSPGLEPGHDPDAE